jgi:DNA-directed RNA polymerase I subunit RPA12
MSSDTVPETIISESKPSAFPSALRAKRSAVQTLSAEDRKTEAVVEKLCENCGRKEMFYTTVQLRSADEGSTVFYRCVCGYKYGIPLRIPPSHILIFL